MNILRPSDHKSFKPVSVICNMLSGEIKSIPPNQGGSIIGACVENVIDSVRVPDELHEDWVEYVYEVSAYWSELNNIDC